MPEKETTLSEDLSALIDRKSETGGRECVDVLVARAKLEGMELREGSNLDPSKGPVRLFLVPEGDPEKTTVVSVYPLNGLISATVCGTQDPTTISHPPSLGMLWGLTESSDVTVIECRLTDFGEKRISFANTVCYCTDGTVKGLFAGSSLVVRQTGADGRDDVIASLRLYSSKILQDLLAGKIHKFDNLCRVEGVGTVEFAINRLANAAGCIGTDADTLSLDITIRRDEKKLEVMKFGHVPVRVTAESLMETFRTRLMDLALTGGIANLIK